MSYLPVVIIGAGRSGTNMLRDILTKLPGVVTWPCDEINYVWRHGNLTEPTDEFDAELATASVQKYVVRAFDRLQSPQVTHIVEKTCANSLRVGFVHRILPDARFVYLVRDGRDVALSASRRWTAPLDVPYLMRKARYVPTGDLPYYAARYFYSRMHRWRSREKRLSFWGPRYRGMVEAHKDHSLLEVCALQWQRCVQCSDDAFEKMDPSRVCQLYYEDFVANPSCHVDRLISFLNIESGVCSTDLVAGVSAKSIGSAARALSQQDWQSLTKLVRGTLERHNYADNVGIADRRAA